MDASTCTANDVPAAGDCPCCAHASPRAMLTRFAYQLLDQLEAAAGSDESGADATADQIRGEDAAPRDASIGSGHQSMLPGFQNNAAAHGASQSAAAPLDPAPCCSPAVAQAEAASPLMPSPGHVHGACGHMPVRTPCDLDTDDTAVQVTVSMQPAISPQLTTAEQKPSSSAAVGLSAPTDSGSKSVWVPARQLKTTWAEYVGSDEDSGDDAEEASGDESPTAHVAEGVPVVTDLRDLYKLSLLKNGIKAAH